MTSNLWTSIKAFSRAAQLRQLAAVLSIIAAGSAAQASTLATWTFETSLPAATNSAAIGPLAAEVGTGNASGLHASANTDYSNPAGNGSNESFSANEWAVGDYFQFETSSAGFQGIVLDWDQTASNTGPGHFQLQYSTDGTSYTNSGAVYTVAANLNPPGFWNATTYINGYHFTVNLSSVPALDNDSSIYFRLTMADTTGANGTLATSGTNRVDNFSISANPVPEPSTVALAGVGLAAVAGLVWRRRRAG